MSNPFIFGEAVGDEAFCGRREEQASLMRDLGDSQKLFLISPRRYGKTSLLRRVLGRLRRKGLMAVYVDLYRASSLQGLIELYCSAVAKESESVLDRALRFMRDVLPRIRPKVTIEADGTPSIGIEPVIGKKDILSALGDALEFPALVAKRKGKRMVVVFDEFQEIANFDGESIEKMMRSHIQHHRMVGYVLSGSKQHMLEEMFQRRDRAFFQIGKAIYLQKIPRKDFLPFLRKKFTQGGFTLDDGVLDEVMDAVEDIPYNVQYVCHELWDRCRDERRVRAADVGSVISVILDEQTPFFIPHWDALSLNQRTLLKAISMHGGVNVFSQDFLRASGIGSLPTLQTSLKLLVKKGIVEKPNGGYAIADIFFREWIRRKM